MSTELLTARLEKDLLIFDGAMGTELYRKNFFARYPSKLHRQRL